MFSCNPSANVGGTFFIGSVYLYPSKIIQTFGQPLQGDMAKIFGEFFFSGPDGTVFTLYDWKNYTNCWDPLHNAEEICLHIGGTEKSRFYLEDFRKWLSSQTSN